MSARFPFEIEVIGLKETIAEFRGIEESMLDFRQLGAWDAVQAEFYRIEAEQFASEGGKGAAGKWQKLTDRYLKRKTKLYGPKPILEATGTLRDSLTKATAKGAVVEKTAQELTLGSDLPVAGYHQRGSGKLPQRKVIDLSDESKERLIKPIQAKMKQLAGNAKLRHLQSI